MAPTLNRIGIAAVVAVTLLAGTARPVHASLILTITEVAGDVVISGSGTADLDDLAIICDDCFNFVAIDPSDPTAVLGDPAPSSDPTDIYSGIVGPTSFGAGGGTFATSGTGDRFGIQEKQLEQSENLILPDGYVSGSPLTGTAVFAAATFASLGVTPGTYVWTWGAGEDADSLTLQIGPTDTAVPEPASLTLLGLGLAGMAARRWRQRKVS